MEVNIDVPFTTCRRCKIQERAIPAVVLKNADGFKIHTLARPEGWIAGTGDAANMLEGLCIDCGKDWAKAESAFIATIPERPSEPELPPEPPKQNMFFSNVPPQQHNPTLYQAAPARQMMHSPNVINGANSSNSSNRVTVVATSRPAEINRMQSVPVMAKSINAPQTMMKEEKSNVVPNQDPGTKVLSVQENKGY